MASNSDIPASQERILDAEAIEQAASSMTRPTARMHLEALAKKLRKESEALARVEASRAKSEASDEANGNDNADPEVLPSASNEEPEVPPAPVSVAPAPRPATAVAVSPSVKYTTIDRFAFDAGKYGAEFVSVYVSLPSVGSISKENITCDFETSKFDLIVRDLNGKSYRLLKDNLEKDINAERSKIIVKADKIVIKLAKVKSDYGSYESWTKLSDPKKKDKQKKSSSNPQDSIMDLMKDMYDSGDDKMRKVIGEAMMKTNRGEEPSKPNFDDMK